MLTADEKVAHDDGDDDELSRSYIPLSLAKSKLSQLTSELSSMKAAHVARLDEVAAKYESLNHAARQHYEQLLNETKARASLRLKENKATIESLREDLIQAHEEAAKNAAAQRKELRQAFEQQANLQQQLLDSEAALEELRKQHQQTLDQLQGRSDEIASILSTHISREDIQALTDEKAGLEQRLREEQTKFEQQRAQMQEKIDTQTRELDSFNEVRTQLEDTRALLESNQAELDAARRRLEEVQSTSATEKEEAQRQVEEIQQKLLEQETRAQSLEMQLAAAQSAVSSSAENGGGEGSSPGVVGVKIVPVPDPELQQKIRSYESELNKLLRENVELSKMIEERDRMVQANNQIVEKIRAASMQAAAARAKQKQPIHTNEGEGAEGREGEQEMEDVEVQVEEDAPSEYEDVQTEEEVEEEVAVADEPGSVPSTSSSAADSARRSELTSQLTSLDSSLATTNAGISALEKELKPKVSNYKKRLADFKVQEGTRKELEASLGLDSIVEPDGSTHDLRATDLSEVETLLDWSTEQASMKPLLATRVQQLKEAKKKLETNKVNLAELKGRINEMKAAGEETDKIKAKEAEFLALRTSMQADAVELKSNYAEYEEKLKSFKEREATLQGLYTKYKIDPEAATAEGGERPRKLSDETKESLKKLVEMTSLKNKEREALKALAEEVNAQNTQLKALKAERETTQTQIKSTKDDLEKLSSAAPSSEGATSTGPTPRIIKRMIKRPVMKRVKKPARKVTVKRLVPRPKPHAANGATTTTVADTTSNAVIPVELLEELIPIELKDGGGSNKLTSKYSSREFTPITPIPFKSTPSNLPTDLTTTGTSPSATSTSTSDPELQSKYDTLQAKMARLQSELDGLRSQASSHHGASAEEVAAKDVELKSLRDQVALLSQGSGEEVIQGLNEQLEKARKGMEEAATMHSKRLAELQGMHREAQRDIDEKTEEIQKLKRELKQMEEQVKQANKKAADASAAAAAAAATAAASSSADGGKQGGGGADPAQLIALQSQLASVQTELSSTQEEMNATSTQLAEARSSLDASQAQLSSTKDLLKATQQERDEQAHRIVDLQTKLAVLEEQVARHAGGLSEALAAKEKELKDAHEAQLAELQQQLNESEEKLAITKKKAKELHEALQKEMEKNAELTNTVAGLNDKITGLESLAQEAEGKMVELRSEISVREQTISKKEEEITHLNEEKTSLAADNAYLTQRNVEEIRRRKEFQFKYEDAKGKVRVYARVRPFSKQEIQADEKCLLRPGTNEWTLCINEPKKNYQGVVTDSWRPIEFDHVFHFGLDNTKGNGSQAEVFEETVIFADLAVQGVNCCVFAYGQSGTGKTFTMAGVKPSADNGHTKDLLGLKPRMIERIYAMKREMAKSHQIDVSCYMLEIYLNKLEDVFWKLKTQRAYAGKEKAKWPEPPELKVRADAKKKVSIENSVILKFDTAQEMQEFCDAAESMRRVRRTGLNEESSRSHLIFALIVQSLDLKTGKKTTGKLSLVDLAGSERADKTNVDGLSKANREKMMEEGIAINESLRMLKQVFRVLGEQNKPVEKGKKAEIVQYRGNMLTEVMQDSLGGNAKTLMFVNVGPAASNISETVDSLQYGDLVKNITNEKASADADLEEQLRFLAAKVRAYEAKYGAIETLG